MRGSRWAMWQIASALLALVWSMPLHAAPIFEGGWTLDAEGSTLRFQSVKNGSKVESSNFRTMSGEIAPDGRASIRIALDSVDTNVDLRNVRMRFLFFETFQYPEAVITVALDAAMLAALPEKRRLLLDLPYRLDLHGATRDDVAQISVVLLSQDMVAVSSAAPISIPVAEFGLSEGLRKLEAAANVTVVPSATISFDFIFSRSPTGSGTPEMAGAAPPIPQAPALPDTRKAPAPSPSPVPAGTEVLAPAALETAGTFDREACLGRFEILSRTDNISFASGSARLDESSGFILRTLADIVSRCPDMRIEIGGHTDAIGGERLNARLSEQRARTVLEDLLARGIAAERLEAKGYGETRPAFDNATAEGRRRNRRIEFAVIE